MKRHYGNLQWSVRNNALSPVGSCYFVFLICFCVKHVLLSLFCTVYSMLCRSSEHEMSTAGSIIVYHVIMWDGIFQWYDLDI